jgi:hypothetical protein
VQNSNIKRYEFEYEIPEELLEPLLSLAKVRDKAIKELVIEAIEQFVVRELGPCLPEEK